MVTTSVYVNDTHDKFGDYVTGVEAASQALPR